jgi:hypothetical protein
LKKIGIFFFISFLFLSSRASPRPAVALRIGGTRDPEFSCHPRSSCHPGNRCGYPGPRTSFLWVNPGSWINRADAIFQDDR